MKWASVLTEGEKLQPVLEQGAAQLLEALQGFPDLVLVFVSARFRDHYPVVSDTLLPRLDNPLLLGCSAGGVIAAGRELEQRPGVALVGASLPGVRLRGFYLDDGVQARMLAGLENWSDLLGVDATGQPAFVLIPEPFSCDASAYLHGLDLAYPDAAKIGGLASGGDGPGAHALFLNEHCHRGGLVGLALSGNLRMDTVVAQGCRPIGEPMFVTRAERDMLLGLDGETPLAILRRLVGRLDPRDRQLATQALFLGIAMRGERHEYRQGDFLIRNLVGLDPDSGALAVGGVPQENSVVQFHVRDARTSSEDLHALLTPLQSSTPAGALLFSCLGRGEGLYGESNHDSEMFRRRLGPVPLGGFFCNGEIGPVHGSTFLHGYTSAFGLFRPRDDHPPANSP